MKRWIVIVLMSLAGGACAGGSDKAAEDVTPTDGSAESFPAALSEDPYEPDIDPADFTTEIDNPYLPLAVGTTYVLEGRSDGEDEVTTVEVTDETKEVMGVETVVVRDEVKVDGETAELTYDWFAQDADGNVWYFGEETYEYEDGKRTSDHGSWEAGKDGAQPGIVMPADPEVGLEYREEYYVGEAEDTAKIIAIDETVETDMQRFTDVVVTENRNPLEPKIVERKYYAKGFGVVVERVVKGGDEKFELTRIDRP